jgi:hypothetical protein
MQPPLTRDVKGGRRDGRQLAIRQVQPARPLCQHALHPNRLILQHLGAAAAAAACRPALPAGCMLGLLGLLGLLLVRATRRLQGGLPC